MTVQRRAVLGPSLAGLPLLTLGFLTGCASSTVGSGVGDTWLDQPPYYAGNSSSDAASALPGDVLYLPVYVQPDPDTPPRMGASRGDGDELERFVDAMNRHMADSGPARGWRRAPSAIPAAPPDVRLGCEQDPMGDCLIEEDELGNDVWNDRIQLSVTRGSGEWRNAALEMLEREDASALVVVTIETGWHWPRQTNWRGSKVVELGTDRVQELPWLTALDRPVQVLQITGMAFGPDGRVRRIGGEGLLARRTPILLSGLGVDALVSENDITRLLEGDGETHDWKAALDSLLDGLLPRG